MLIEVINHVPHKINTTIPKVIDMYKTLLKALTTVEGITDVSGIIRICTKKIPLNPMRIVEAMNNDITNSAAWLAKSMLRFYHVEIICQEYRKPTGGKK
jgi:L-lysine 2,3-aminomutase